jgi:hypothetical protein
MQEFVFGIERSILTTERVLQPPNGFHRNVEMTRNNFLRFPHQLTNILDSFTLISTKLSPSSDLGQEMILYHQRRKTLNKSTLLAQLNVIGATTAEFAKAQVHFSSLGSEDQEVLLKNNIPLYLQYVLARYFSADTGLEQLSWIFEGQIGLEAMNSSSRFFRISLTEYNETASLFQKSENFKLFSRFVENIGMFFPFPQVCNGFLANMLLYYVDDSVIGSLKEKEKITCLFREAKDLVVNELENQDRNLSFSEGGINIGPLIQTLKKMKALFGECMELSKSQVASYNIPKLMTISYTQGEEVWIQGKFLQFQTEYKSVIPPADYFQELLDLLLEAKKVSETFIATWMGMEMERFRRILKMHPEFQKLSDRDQEMLLRNNQSSATALSVVRIEIQTSGKDQFKQIVGVIDSNKTDWENEYNQSIDIDKFKSSYLHKKELNLGKLDALSIQSYFDILKDLSKMCSNHQLYQLFILLTVLDIDGLPDQRNFIEISRIRQTYLRVFLRKLASMGCAFHNYAHFCNTLSKVKTFANLMQRLV